MYREAYRLSGHRPSSVSRPPGTAFVTPSGQAAIASSFVYKDILIIFRAGLIFNESFNGTILN
jgi:hypothetical protein